jgi:hypothetical protein
MWSSATFFWPHQMLVPLCFDGLVSEIFINFMPDIFSQKSNTFLSLSGDLEGSYVQGVVGIIGYFGGLTAC